MTQSVYEPLGALACEQALWGTLVAGQEKEGQFSTTSLKFEYLHWKSRCKMLMGWDDISNEVITLGTCFSMFVQICACLPALCWLAEIWQLSRRWATGELEVEFKFWGRSSKLSFLFPPRHQSEPESLLAGYGGSCWDLNNMTHLINTLHINGAWLCIK